MIRKIFAVAVSACLLAAIFAGCSNSGTVSKKAAISVETTFGNFDVSGPAYKELLESFADEHKNIAVTDSSIRADDNWKAKIRSSFEAGQEPDVTFFYTNVDAKDIVESGKAVPLSEIRKVYPDYGSNIKPEAITAVTEKDGEAYCLPIIGFWEGMIYNKQLFDEYKVQPITDWKSLLAAVAIFKENGVTPIAASFSDIPNYWIEHSIMAYSGIKGHSLTPTVGNLPNEWVGGLEKIKELYDVGAFQEDCLSTQHDLAVQSFNTGQAAMILDGSWMRVDESMANNAGVFAFPHESKIAKEERGVISGFSMGFYISTKAWNDESKRDACVTFVEYMTSNESIAKICKPRAGAMAVDVKISGEQSLLKRDAMRICKENTLEMPIDSRLSKSAWEYMLQKIPSMLKGEISSAEIVENVAEYDK